MAVSSIEVEMNDKPDIEPVEHETHIRLRISDTHSIVLVKKLIELELANGETKIDAIVSIISDTSDKNLLDSHWTRLAPFDLWVTKEKWQLDSRLWKKYPDHALLPITTWEEEKPATVVVFTDGYCDDLR